MPGDLQQHEGIVTVLVPKVSVCIPTYNYAEYISFAVESVLNQTFQDFELIILDDCSSDGTQEVVQKYLTDERIIFEVNSVNLGLPGNWNRCIEKARGKYIKFILADDMFASSDALARMVSVLDSNPEISIVASARNIIDSQSQLVRIASEFKSDFTIDGEILIYYCLREINNLIGEPTVVMFRRSDGLRGFDSRYCQLVDMEMWLHLLEKGRFAFINTPLASFRIHSRQKTLENTKSLIFINELHLMLEEYSSKPYMKVGFIRAYYWKYNAIYLFWKAKKRGLISRKEACAKIAAIMPLKHFIMLYPLYKVVKPIEKLLRKLGIIRQFKYCN
jgi:glycosyltransferase involved in cell wall biosynthesis